MARRGRDLFEILGAHVGGKRLSPRAAGRRARGAEPGTVMDVGAGFLDWFSRRFPGGQVKEGDGASVPGLLFAVVVLVSMVVGFAIGRLTSGTASAAELQRTVGPPGQRPGWLEQGAPVELTQENEEKKISNTAFVLLGYPPENRSAASHMAAWLRGQAIQNARIHYMELSSGFHWLVLCYTTIDQDSETTFQALRRLPAPDFDENFAAAIAKLAPRPNSIH